MKKLILDETYQKLGAKMVEFANWSMPIYYDSLIKEHQKVRESAGLFDVSHMGEIEVKGENAFNFLQKLLTNDLSKIKDKQIQYTMMCYEDGGVVDDLLVYRFSADRYILVVNASNIEQDYKWITSKDITGVEINNLSTEIAQLALQGPKAEKVLQRLTGFDLKSLKFFYFAEDVEIAGVKTLFLSRTGYTGEDGFEIYLTHEEIKKIWDSILEYEEVIPVGLGARETLRFEVNLPLYGQEIGKDKNPIEAGLGYFVALDKEDFIGKAALKKIKEEGLKRKIIGLEMIDRGIAREGYQVFKDEKPIGEITTGSYSPTLDKNIALAYLKLKYTELGTRVMVKIRKRDCEAEVVKLPFYKPSYRK